MSQLDPRILSEKLEERIGGRAKFLLSAVRKGGNSVEWMIGEAEKYAKLISPNGSRIPHDVSFFGPDNTFARQEFATAQAANGINIHYTDPNSSKRPGHNKGFVVGDDLPSSKLSLPDAFGIEMKDLAAAAHNWLSNRSLIAIPSRIANGPNGSALDVLYLAPKELAFAKMAWDIIHGTPTAEDLQQNFNPRAVFFAVPGLRHSHFQDMQSVVFDRCDESGVTLAIANSPYQGLLSKKPIFVLLSRETVENGKGFLAHATMAVLNGKGHLGERTIGTFYSGASGHGKTEWRYIRHGEILLGEGVAGEQNLVIKYPKDDVPKLTAAGDDGVLFRDFTGGNGEGLAENHEKGGAFDRPSGAKKPGDLPENDQICQLTMGRPFDLLTLNMDVKPGGHIETHKRILDERGKPHSNPRMSYKWRDLAQTEAIRSSGVSITTDPVRFQHSVFGMGASRECAIISWANKLPLCSAYTLFVAGICNAKSVSVTDEGGVIHGGLKADRFGTMESFTINSSVDMANRLWEMFASFHKVSHWTTPIGWVGPKFKVDDNQAELLLRDSLLHTETGNATWKLVPGKNPFFGLIPSEAVFLGNRIPETYSDPFRQYSTEDEFIKASRHVMRVIAKAVEPLRFDIRLNSSAREAMERALRVPPVETNPNEALRIFHHLNSVR